MKKIFVLLLTVSLVLGLMTGCGGDKVAVNPGEQVYELRLATTYPQDHHNTISLERAIKKVEEKTEGKVKITLYGAGVLGESASIFEELMKGTIDMALVPCSSQFDPNLEIYLIPYLTPTWDVASKVYSEGSNFWDLFYKMQADLGVEMLGIYQDGYMGIAGTKLNFDGIMDPNKKKSELMSTPPMDTYVIVAEALGYDTITIPFSDLYTSLQTGICDARIFPPLLQYTGYRDVMKSYADLKFMQELSNIMMNKKLFDSMPEDISTVIHDAFAEESMIASGESEELEAQAIEDLRDYGCDIFIPNDEELNELASYYIENVWPTYEKMFGKEIMDKLIEDTKN